MTQVASDRPVTAASPGAPEGLLHPHVLLEQGHQGWRAFPMGGQMLHVLYSLTTQLGPAMQAASRHDRMMGLGLRDTLFTDVDI